MKYAIIALVVTLVLAAVGVFFFFPNLLGNLKPKAATEIKTFEECAEAGNLVVNSKPRECYTKGKQVFVEVYNGVLLKDVIKTTEPKPNTLVTSPFRVTGEAVGGWYYADQLMVRLEDDKGKILFLKPFKALESTKTDSFVPFTGAVVFTKAEATTSAGKLVIERTNTEFNDGELGPLVIPVMFEK